MHCITICITVYPPFLFASVGDMGLSIQWGTSDQRKQHQGEEKAVDLPLRGAPHHRAVILSLERQSAGPESTLSPAGAFLVAQDAVTNEKDLKDKLRLWEAKNASIWLSCFPQHAMEAGQTMLCQTQGEPNRTCE